MDEDGDEYFVRGEETSWTLPEGARLAAGEGGAAEGSGAVAEEEVWQVHTEGEDTWYSCGDKTAWSLPAGARLAGASQ